MDSTPANDLTPPPPHDHPSAVAGIRTEDHVVWSVPDHTVAQSFEWRFVVASWAWCLLATLSIGAVVTAIVAAFTEPAIFGETNTHLAMLTIISAMSTFIGFAVVMSLRLVRVAHDRLANSLAVALLHVGLAIVLVGAEFLINATVTDGISAVFDGSRSADLGNIFTVLERSAVASVLACLLSAGMVPARGERPRGTQREFTVTDRQL